MSSALKPVLTTSGAQNPPAQMNKPMHPQGVPTTYSQPTSHIPQNLVNIPHSAPTTNIHNPAHPNAHHLNTNANNTNHYSLNVPNASQNYATVASSITSHAAPGRDHLITMASQQHAQPVSTYSSAPKNLTYGSNYSANLAHSYRPTTTASTLQNLSAVHAPTNTSTAPTEENTEKPQSNGTPEIKILAKPEAPQNHVATANVKDKPPPSIPPPLSAVQALPTVDKAKIVAEKPTEVVEQKTHINVNKTPAESSTNITTSPNKTLVVSPTVSSTSASPVTTSGMSTTASPPVPTITSKVVSPATTTTVNVTTVASSVSTAVTNAASPPAGQTVTSSASSDSGGSQSSNVSSVSTIKPKEQNNQKPTLKLATTPRIPVRKAKTQKQDLSGLDTSKGTKSELKAAIQKTSPGSTLAGKSKRTRTRTQPYQSPLPEVEMISKISANLPRNRNNEDKLIIFYKNEFLAVRNSDGGFYICQAVQNIYKSSPRIRIRWLSQDKGDKDVYSPDFYDYTDFDCILTNLNLARVGKGKFKLPSAEKVRTDSILKRALAVEKGDATPPSLTEEHPDGLDLSLYKEESQLKKRKSTKRKASSPPKTTTAASPAKKSPEQAKVRKITPKFKSELAKKNTVLKKALITKTKKNLSGRAERAAKRSLEVLKNSTKHTPVIDHKKAKVLAKVARKKNSGSKIKQQPPSKQNAKTAKPQSYSVKKPAATKKPVVVATTRKSKRGKK